MSETRSKPHSGWVGCQLNDGAQETMQPLDAQQTLAAWRHQGMQRLNPVRFAFIEALARRATQYQGAARRLIDHKLTRLLAEYGDSLVASKTLSTPKEAAQDREPPSPRSALAALVDQVGERQSNSGKKSQLVWNTTPNQVSAPESKTLADLRATWTKLSAQQRLKDALACTPHKAGPLNSEQLVHRCLLLMNELSPGYLQHFMSTVDALTWATQLNRSLTPTGNTTAPARTRGKPTRGKPG